MEIESQQKLNYQKWMNEMNDPSIDHFGALFGAAADEGAGQITSTPIGRESSNSLIQNKRISEYTKERERGSTLMGINAVINPMD